MPALAMLSSTSRGIPSTTQQIAAEEKITRVNFLKVVESMRGKWVVG
jgi:DNA-binding IscR family transcriptional regulator